MLMFFSGSTSADNQPEVALCDIKPGVMLTYWELDGKRGDTTRRFERHDKQRKDSARKSRKSAKRT